MIFEGTATALVTPFAKDKVDENALEKLIEYQINGNVDALVLLGTTGESATLTQSERRRIIEIAKQKISNKIPLIVGAGSNDTRHAIELCKDAQQLGADGLLLVTPYYNKCTQEGLVKHYSTIASVTSLPIIAYNVPSRTGVNILPDTFKRIIDENKNIVAIKEASGNMSQIMECIRLARGKASVYSGDDALSVPTIAMGGKGVISVASNLLPKEMSDMTSSALSGDFAKASKIQLALLPLINALFCEVNPIPIKQALALKGLCQNNLRLPLIPMSEQNIPKLKNALHEFERTCIREMIE